MSDIALAVGAKYFSQNTGDDLSLIKPEHLGHADKIISSRDNTIIIKENTVSEELQSRIDELVEARESFEKNVDKKFINERIASLAGSIGCIYVGGYSDIEQKEKFDRVDDSVCAVRSALEEGIVPGGGLSLYECGDYMTDQVYKATPEDSFTDEDVANLILGRAIKEPFFQILTNAGIEVKYVINKLSEINRKHHGFDVKNEVFGDMYKMGVIDPLKVTKNALLNAVSVATTILSTNAIVTNKR